MKKAIQINNYGKKYGIFHYDGTILKGYCNFVFFHDFYPNYVGIYTLEEARSTIALLKKNPEFKKEVFIRRISGKYISNLSSINGNRYRVLWKDRQKKLVDIKDLSDKELQEKHLNGLNKEYTINNVFFKEETLTGYI